MPARRDKYGFRTGTPTDEYNRRRREMRNAPLGRPDQQPTLPSDQARQGQTAAQQRQGQTAAQPAYPRMSARRTASPMTPMGAGQPGQRGLQPGETRTMSGRVAPPRPDGTPYPQATGPIGGMGRETPEGELSRPASTLAPGQFYASPTRGGQPAAQPGAQPGAQPDAAQPKYLWQFQPRIRHPQTGERSVLQDAAREQYAKEMMEHFVDPRVSNQLRGAGTLEEYDEIFREQGREAGLAGHVDAEFMDIIMERYEQFMPAPVKAEYEQQRNMERSRAQAERTLEAMPESQREGLTTVLDPQTGQYKVGEDLQFKARQEQQAEMQKRTQQLQDNPWMAPDMPEIAAQAGVPPGNETWQAMPSRARQIAYEQAMIDLPNAMQGSPDEQARVQAFEERYGIDLGIEMPEARPSDVDIIRESARTGRLEMALRDPQSGINIETLDTQSPEARKAVIEEVGAQRLQEAFGYREGEGAWNIGELGRNQEAWESYLNPGVTGINLAEIEKPLTEDEPEEQRQLRLRKAYHAADQIRKTDAQALERLIKARLDPSPDKFDGVMGGKRTPQEIENSILEIIQHNPALVKLPYVRSALLRWNIVDK